MIYQRIKSDCMIFGCIRSIIGVIGDQEFAIEDYHKINNLVYYLGEKFDLTIGDFCTVHAGIYHELRLGHTMIVGKFLCFVWDTREQVG